jgi:hypothetical protein
MYAFTFCTSYHRVPTHTQPSRRGYHPLPAEVEKITIPNDNQTLTGVPKLVGIFEGLG